MINNVGMCSSIALLYVYCFMKIRWKEYLFRLFECFLIFESRQTFSLIDLIREIVVPEFKHSTSYFRLEIVINIIKK